MLSWLSFEKVCHSSLDKMFVTARQIIKWANACFETFFCYVAMKLMFVFFVWKQVKLQCEIKIKYNIIPLVDEDTFTDILYFVSEKLKLVVERINNILSCN